jgi:hypothetical protein
MTTFTLVLLIYLLSKCNSLLCLNNGQCTQSQNPVCKINGVCGCNTNSDCNERGKCVNGSCVCTSNTDCLIGRCTSGTCINSCPCTNIFQPVCISGSPSYCGCTSNSDCGISIPFCNLVTKTCSACTKNSECSHFRGTFCINGECVSLQSNTTMVNAWNNQTSYCAGSLVSYNGEYWVSKISTSMFSPNFTDWTLLNVQSSNLITYVLPADTNNLNNINNNISSTITVQSALNLLFPKTITGLGTSTTNGTLNQLRGLSSITCLITLHNVESTGTLRPQITYKNSQNITLTAPMGGINTFPGCTSTSMITNELIECSWNVNINLNSTYQNVTWKILWTGTLPIYYDYTFAWKEVL